METIQQTIITEKQVVAPLEAILEKTILGNSNSFTLENIPKTIKQSLDELFPEQQREEKNVQRAKDTLGALADQFTQEQLKETVTEIQYLVDSWLDDFERKTFKGQTLNELLHERGGQ